MINYQDFIHPEDEAARRQLEAVPGFTTAMKGFLKFGFEQFFYGFNMANKIRLGENQLPELYRRLPPICSKLGIPVPEFYLEMNPMPNSYTFGDSRIFLIVTSGLLEYLDDAEIDAVLAHECGHIVCRHVLYHTMGYFLIRCAESIGIAGNMALPMQLALSYWERRSELSADRAAAAVMGSADPVVNTMIRLSGGPKSITKNVNIDTYTAQATAYEELQMSKWDKILQTMAIMNETHPFPAVRAREIKQWVNEERYSTIIAALNETPDPTKCPICKNDVSAEWKFCKYCGNTINYPTEVEI